MFASASRGTHHRAVRIAVLADTHNHLPSSLRPLLTTADEIWHLGDIGHASLLRELRGLGPPVHAIRGNCDPASLAPETLTLTREQAERFIADVDCLMPMKFYGAHPAIGELKKEIEEKLK